ncbi:N-acetyltransferase family protein [Actinomycetota bacterium Odt1-20B]
MDQRFRLREATIKDLDMLTDVHTRTRTAYYAAGGVPEGELADPAAWSERRDAWARVLTTSTRTTLCAEGPSGTVVGLLTAGPPHQDDLDAASNYELYQIGVLPNTWGHGVGGALHREFMVRAVATGCDVGVLECWASNTRAQRFYAWHGWRPDGTRREGPMGNDYIRLRLKIDPNCR